MARPIIVDGSNVAWEEQTADGKPRVANMFDRKAAHQAPAGRAADAFVLQLADEQDCPFVSNDLFQPYRDRYPWIEDRRRPYMIVDGRFYLGRRPPDGEKEG